MPLKMHQMKLLQLRALLKTPRTKLNRPKQMHRLLGITETKTMMVKRQTLHLNKLCKMPQMHSIPQNRHSIAPIKLCKPQQQLRQMLKQLLTLPPLSSQPDRPNSTTKTVRFKHFKTNLIHRRQPKKEPERMLSFNQVMTLSMVPQQLKQLRLLRKLYVLMMIMMDNKMMLIAYQLKLLKLLRLLRKLRVLNKRCSMLKEHSAKPTLLSPELNKILLRTPMHRKLEDSLTPSNKPMLMFSRKKQIS